MIAGLCLIGNGPGTIVVEANKAPYPDYVWAIKNRPKRRYG